MGIESVAAADPSRIVDTDVAAPENGVSVAATYAGVAEGELTERFTIPPERIVQQRAAEYAPPINGAAPALPTMRLMGAPIGAVTELDAVRAITDAARMRRGHWTIKVRIPTGVGDGP